GFDCEPGADPAKARTGADACRQPAPECCPDDEGTESGSRSSDGKLGDLGHGEPEEDDVAGHVRGEDVTEREVTDRVDESRHCGESEEQRRQDAIRSGRVHPGMSTSMEAGRQWFATRSSFTPANPHRRGGI